MAASVPATFLYHLVGECDHLVKRSLFVRRIVL